MAGNVRVLDRWVDVCIQHLQPDQYDHFIRRMLFEQTEIDALATRRALSHLQRRRWVSGTVAALVRDARIATSRARRAHEPFATAMARVQFLTRHWYLRVAGRYQFERDRLMRSFDNDFLNMAQVMRRGQPLHAINRAMVLANRNQQWETLENLGLLRSPAVPSERSLGAVATARYNLGL